MAEEKKKRPPKESEKAGQSANAQSKDDDKSDKPAAKEAMPKSAKPKKSRVKSEAAATTAVEKDSDSDSPTSASLAHVESAVSGPALREAAPAAKPEENESAKPIESEPSMSSTPAVDSDAVPAQPTDETKPEAGNEVLDVKLNASSTSEPTSQSPSTKLNSSKFRPKAIIAKLWWLPLSFGVPFLLVFLLTHNNKMEDRLFLSTRSAAVGLVAASIIFILSAIDSQIDKHLPKVKDINAEILAKALAMVLWLVWMGAGHIMILATDEISSDLPPAVSPE